MEKISWKQKIKNLQILFLIGALFVYFSYTHFTKVYSSYSSSKHNLEKIKIEKITKQQEKLESLKQKEQLFENLLSKDLKIFFIDAYNYCYPKYISKIYGLNSKISSLSNCIDSKMTDLAGIKYNNHFIKQMKDIELEKIAMLLGIHKNKLEKFNIDHKLFLYSLDMNIFDNQLEEKVSVLSLGKPILLDNNLKLYKESFTFSVNVDYKGFLQILQKLQNVLQKRNNVYYTISNVSSFDITKPEQIQTITIQGNFYFTK